MRDELSGWIAGMNTYNDNGRAFWVEAYGGRPYRVERQRHEPIDIPRLAVAVYGSVQPDKLAELMRQPDDGPLSPRPAKRRPASGCSRMEAIGVQNIHLNGD
jgi:hypothetical protein